MSLHPRRCPICGVETNYIYHVEESDRRKAKWYRCTCGVIFQEEFNPQPKKEDLSGSEKNQVHAVKTYASLIEELTYGRMMLHPGNESCPKVIKEFEDRGWLAWGIDEQAEQPGGAKYKGDILTYDFNPCIKDDELKKEIGKVNRTFDLIWFQHHIEHKKNPLAVLNRVYELLSNTGVIFISTPDIDFIHKQGIQYWPYWKRKENYVLWSEPALKREVERLGFKVIMSRRNYAARFMGHFDIHLIAQKRYF